MSNPARVMRMMVAVLAAAVLAALQGCEVAGFVLASMPPPKVEAVYELVDQPTVILIDDPAQLMPSIQVMGLTAYRAGADLKEQEVIAEVVPSTATVELRLDEPEFVNWPIDKIGKRLGAKQVVYVLVEAFQLKDQDQMYRPAAAMRVKVVDAETGQRLFPADRAEGHQVISRLFFKGHESTGTAGSETVLTRKLADRMGEDVAKVFYKHAPRPVGSDFSE